MKKTLLPFLFLLLSIGTTYATHIRAGEITVRRIGCAGNTFEFTLTGYRDTGSDILFGNGIFDYGDGSEESLRPGDFSRKELLDEEVELVEFKFRHTYASNGTYIVSYFEEFRNVGIANINQSGTVPFYVETVLRINPFFGCNSSPVFLIPPVDKGAIGVPYFHNPGAFDPDGDSISFKLTISKAGTGIEAPGYQFPEVRSGGQNSQQTGPATLTLGQTTGDLIWDAPALQGEFNVAFVAEEWRKIGDEWRFMGSVTRDMQIIVETTENDPPELEIPMDTCVEAGTLLEAEIIARDPNPESLVEIEAFGGPFILNPAATLSPDPPILSESPTSAFFSWQTDCSHIREEPYLVRFKASDDGPGIRLTAFETWRVTVVPPAPENVTVEPRSGQSLEINWDQYDCGAAELIDVYRRVDSFAFEPQNCELGIPENAGYELIASVPISETSFIDDNGGEGLPFGANFCYRLVATFEEPAGGISYASEEVCQQIVATGPIITNVDINETSTQDGVITIKWLTPFEIDTDIFPPPYKYRLLRENAGSLEEVDIIEDDTIFVDRGLNTENRQISYQLEMYGINDEINEDNLIEISSPASSVRLGAVSGFQSISLNWQANVPWSNTVQSNPYHYIYRDRNGNGNALTLIDSVDVTQFGYNYTDSGQFNGVELENDAIYCYYVTTTGSYGNENIPSPLLNNSQILCARPDDQIDPCPPFDASFEIDSDESCQEFLADKPCSFSDFSNTIRWSASTNDSCDTQISYYQIFYTNELDGEFEQVGTSTDTVFVHQNLPEFAGCYMIRAVDQSGNFSEFSETFCKENCPNVAFPNLFSPNDDGFNDLFSPYYPGGNNNGAIPLENCPRFLEAINFTVFNRYGKEVYRYESGGENSVYINWDGKDLNGQDLPSGAYYYEARVTFDMLRPSNKEQLFKGWVQIAR